MPRKALKKSCNDKTKTSSIRKEVKKGKLGLNKGSLAAHLSVQLGQVSLIVRNQQSPTFNLASNSRFQALVEAEAEGLKGGEVGMEAEGIGFEFGVGERDEKEFILSQDFFWYVLGLKFSFLLGLVVVCVLVVKVLIVMFS